VTVGTVSNADFADVADAADLAEVRREQRANRRLPCLNVMLLPLGRRRTGKTKTDERHPLVRRAKFPAIDQLTSLDLTNARADDEPCRD